MRDTGKEGGREGEGGSGGDSEGQRVKGTSKSKREHTYLVLTSSPQSP